MSGVNDTYAAHDDLVSACRSVLYHLDSGTAFESKCRASVEFAQLVHHARFLRAFHTSELRKIAAQ